MCIYIYIYILCTYNRLTHAGAAASGPSEAAGGKSSKRFSLGEPG